MNLRYSSALDEAVGPSDSDHPLLEHWTTLCGRQLMLCVTAEETDSPDTVTVHVRYGGGRTKVTVSAEEDSSESDEATAESRASELGTDLAPELTANLTEACKESEPSLSDEAKDSEQLAARTSDDAYCDDAGELPASDDKEPWFTAPTVVDTGDQHHNAKQERDVACAGGDVQRNAGPLEAFTGEQAADVSKGNTEPSASPNREQDPVLPATDVHSHETDAVMEKGDHLCPPDREHENAVLLAEKSPEKPFNLVAEGSENESSVNVGAGAHPEVSSAEQYVNSDIQSPEAAEAAETDDTAKPVTTGRHHALAVTSADEKSSLSPDIGASPVIATMAAQDKMPPSETVTSNKAHTTVTDDQSAASTVPGPAGNSQVTLSASSEPCEATRTELRIGRFDNPIVLNDKTLEKLLRDMPDLRCLSIEWRLDGRKLDIDVVTRHCQNLVEVDLSRFRLDAWSLEQLCVACPGLEVVKLPRKCDDSCVKVLLRNLPKLRSLDLTNTQVTGEFLLQSHESLEKISIARCGKLQLKQLLDASENTRRMACWEKIRELDLSFTQMTSADLKVLKYFPGLKRMSLAHCTKTESTILDHVAQCGNLRYLDVSHVESLQFAGLPSVLVRCSRLERLAFAGCSVSKYWLAPSQQNMDIHLGQIRLCLRELDVADVKGLGASDLEAILSRSPQLERLRASGLADMNVSSCLNQLSGRAELREVDVSRQGTLKKALLPKRDVFGYRASPDSKEYMNSRQIQANVLTAFLVGCPKLERLVLAGCHIPEPFCLRQLAQCPKLREVDLSRVTTGKTDGPTQEQCDHRSVDASDLAEGLGGCLSLERLFVAGHEAPLEQLVPPTGLPRLTYLNVSQSGLTNNSLRRLPGLFPRLQTLIMHECTSVSEDGLMHYLPRLQHLRCLNLGGVPGVTNSVLAEITGCQLSKLCLYEYEMKQSCRFSTEGVERFVRCCPSLKMLGMSVTDHSYLSRSFLEDPLRRQLLPNRTLVMRYEKKGDSSHRQYGPLFTLGDDVAAWDRA